ncbi:hypothetical protein HMPREF1214_04899 [Bacteroides sp. HPS0048]|jgi:hypothetical protein|uniref:hypothetical protein n=1 Tax=Bacteroides sp. HPS0048 TaxID=1078089 RepID=UPI0003613FC3|nr:hypothetical protein [Bacteroides sp. HPS0048]EOA51975.1 hypothetical protein HMPREF1214_04899 [Bacteroides sp. HPS0048]
MRTKKTPYSAANSLRLIPVDKIYRFALITSRAFVSFQNGDYEIPIVPGTFMPDVQSEEAEGGLVYNVGHTFNVALIDIANEHLLAALSKQELIAIYTDEAGNDVVSGTQQTPLTFTYAKVSGQYQCKLTGIMSHSEAFYSPF